MRERRLWVISLSATFVFVLSVAFQSLAAESGLFEDDETIVEAPSSSGIQVPRTEEALKLAQQLIGNLKESYYFLRGTGTGAFEASFSVKEGGLALGSLKASWDAKEGRVSTEFSGKPGYPNADWLEQLSWVGLSESLSRSFVPRGLYAAQTDDGYVIADYSVDPTKAKSVRSFVSNDLLQIRKIIRLPADQEKETVWQAQEAKGKNYLASMSITGRIPDEPERKVDFTLTYTTRYGPPFVSKLVVEDSGFDTKGSWILELDKVSFTKAEPTPEPAQHPELFAVQIDSEGGYIDHNGELVIPFQFDMTRAFSEGLAPVLIGATFRQIRGMSAPTLMGGKYGYIDHTGKLVIEPLFESAEPFREGVALVRIREKEYRFIDRAGRFLTEGIFASGQGIGRGGFSDGLAQVYIDGKCGYVDKQGRVVIRPQFSDASTFSEGLAPVAIEEHKWGYIDRNGKLVVRPQFYWARPISEGLAQVQFGKASGYKFGYMDKTGKTVIQPSFDEAEAFSEGLAGVRVQQKWGHIDKAGKWIAQPKFDGAGDFSGGLAPVKAGEKWGYVDKTGKFVVQPQYDFAIEFSGSLASVESGGRWLKIDRTGKVVWDPLARIMGKALYPVLVGGKWGYIDRLGKIVVQPRFEAAGPFSEGLGGVRSGGKWGYVDLSGRIAIEPQFDEAYGFSEELAPVKVGDKYGFVDKNGKMAIEAQFEDVWNFAEGFAPVKMNGKVGFIDKAGKMVVEPRFDSTYGFAENVAAVKVGEKWGFMNKAGAIYIEPQFQNVRGFSGGLAPVTTDGKKWGFIHITGTMLIEPQFDYAVSFSEGLAPVMIDKKYGYIDKHGEQVIPSLLQEADQHSEGWAVVEVEVKGETEVFFVSRNHLRRLIQAQGEKWDRAWAFKDGLAKVKVGDKIGYINKTGQYVWEPRE